MITYLIFYDRRGQAQRVATSSNPVDVQRYVDAGFKVVAASEYNRAAALVASASLSDLPALAAAAGLLTQIQRQQRRAASRQSINPASLDTLQARLQVIYRQIATDFTEGRITAEQWYRQMIDMSNRSNIAATALAVGGVGNLSTVDIAEIERMNETQAQYLNRFRRVILTLTATEIIRRAISYLGVTSPLFWGAGTRAMGMPQLPVYPKQRSSCRYICYCHWDVRDLSGNGNWDCYWKLDRHRDNCPECVARAAAFNPLRIRNGVIQPYSSIGLYV